MIKTLIHTTSKKAKLPNKISAEQCTICEPEQIASIFNEFFSNGKNLANKISFENQPCPCQYLPSPVSSSMFLDYPRPNEVFNIIASLSNSRFCGYDDIPSYFLKIAADVISNPLCYLLKHSFSLGIFSSSLKIAKVIPVFKSGAKNNGSNYGPISILPCFFIVLEKLILKRTESFQSKNLILLPTQYGFRAGRSTFHALLDVMTNTFDNISKNMFTALMMLDLKKSFDTVSHDILLLKLHNNRIRGMVTITFPPT